MNATYTPILVRDGGWWIAWCDEVPGANGQGRTPEEARASLDEAVALILEDEAAGAGTEGPADAP